MKRQHDWCQLVWYELFWYCSQSIQFQIIILLCSHLNCLNIVLTTYCHLKHETFSSSKIQLCLPWPSTFYHIFIPLLSKNQTKFFTHCHSHPKSICHYHQIVQPHIVFWLLPKHCHTLSSIPVPKFNNSYCHHPLLSSIVIDHPCMLLIHYIVIKIIPMHKYCWLGKCSSLNIHRSAWYVHSDHPLPQNNPNIGMHVLSIKNILVHFP